MILKSITLVAVLLLGVLIMSFGTITMRGTQSSETIYSRRAATLAERVQEAKREGKKRVIFPAPIGIPADVKSLSQAFDYYQVLVAQPIAQESYPQGDEDIITWHKFKIVENLSRANSYHTSHEELEQILPKNISLPKLQDDEVVVPQAGGILNIDGVTLIQEVDEFPLLSAHQKYLLFLSKDPSEKIGKMELGPYGVFTISRNNSLDPLIQQEHPLDRDIRQFYGQSLTRLKAEFK